MTFTSNVAGDPALRQDLPPDALRLAAPCCLPSGLTIGGRASFYVGDGWRTGTVTATGLTTVTIETSRYGTSVVHDGRNVLVGAAMARHRSALAKWRRDRGLEP